MRKLFTVVCLFAITASSGVLAQGNPFAEMTNFHLLFFPKALQYEYNITARIEQDLRIDDTNIFLYNWWPDGSHYELSDGTEKGYYGQIGDYLDCIVTPGGWSGLGFCLDNPTTEKVVDFTKITNEYRFHMLAKSNYQRAHAIKILTTGGGTSAQGAKFSIGMGTEEGYKNITPDFKTDGTWNVIDIPVEILRDRGFTPRAPYGSKNNFFEMLSGPGPNDISIDCIFFYKPTSSSIGEIKEQKLGVIVTDQVVEVLNAKAPIEVYDLTGVKVKTSVQPVFGVEELNKGIYIVKSEGLVAKVLIK